MVFQTFPSLVQLFLMMTALVVVRYAVVAGLAFAVYDPGLNSRLGLPPLRRTEPTTAAIVHDVGLSFLSSIILGGVGTALYYGYQHGITMLYMDLSRWDWLYVPVSYSPCE